LYRANGCSGHPILGVYRLEHVVIGPAKRSYAWVAFAKEHCTAMGFRVSRPMLQRGSRKGGLAGRGSRNWLRKSWAGNANNKSDGNYLELALYAIMQNH